MKDIIFPVDSQETLRIAIEYGWMLSEIFDNRVRILYQTESERCTSVDIHTEIKILFDHFLDGLKDGNHDMIGLETKCITRERHEHILEYAAKLRAGFIAMQVEDLSREGRWERSLENTLIYKVLLHAEIPVFTFLRVPGKQKMTDIVLPIDLSEGTLQKLKYARMISEKTGATIHLISVYHTADEHPMLDHLQRRALRYLRKLPLIKKMIYSGSAPEVIMQYARNIKADLIMIMLKPADLLTKPFVAQGVKMYTSFSQVPVLSIPPGVDWKRPADVQGLHWA